MNKMEMVPPVVALPLTILQIKESNGIEPTPACIFFFLEILCLGIFLSTNLLCFCFGRRYGWSNFFRWLGSTKTCQGPKPYGWSGKKWKQRSGSSSGMGHYSRVQRRWGSFGPDKGKRLFNRILKRLIPTFFPEWRHYWLQLVGWWCYLYLCLG